MKQKRINSDNAPQPVGPYSQALELSQFERLLFISGQVPVDAEGKVPAGFTAQCELTWQNVIAQLHAAGLAVDNLVKVNTFVAGRDYLDSNRAIREKFLGAHQPALSVVIAGIFDEEWLLEIEAIAAA